VNEVVWCISRIFGQKKYYELVILNVSFKSGPCIKLQKHTLFLQQKSKSAKVG